MKNAPHLELCEQGWDDHFADWILMSVNKRTKVEATGNSS